MTSVPPLREDDVALVAGWPARPDTPAQIATQVAVVLRAIGELEPGIAGWKRDRAKAVAAPGDIPALADLIERGAVKDSQRPPVHMEAAGYLQWLYPVGARGVQVMISAGQISDRAISSCVVQIQSGAAELRTAQAAHALITAAVDAFAPRWAAWTRGPLGSHEHVTADGRTLGYLNYGPADQMRVLDSNAAPYGDGAIAKLGDDPEIGDLDVVRRHLDAAGGAAT
jgi:hypothetical protein